MSWIVFALIPQFLWAISVWIDKILLERYLGSYASTVLLLYSSLFSLIVLPFVYLFARDSIGDSFQYAPILLLTGILSIVWIYFYLEALRRDEASIVIPFFQFIPIFGIILSYIMLGETISHIQVVGILLVVSAAVLLASNTTLSSPNHTRVSVLILVLLASFTYSFSNVLFKYGAVDIDFATALLWEHLGSLIAALGIIILSPSGARTFVKSLYTNSTKVFALNFTNEGVTLVGNILFSYALLIGPVALVQTMNVAHPMLMFLGGILFTLFAPRLISEDIEKQVLIRKTIALGVVTCGLVLLYQYGTGG